MADLDQRTLRWVSRLLAKEEASLERRDIIGAATSVYLLRRRILQEARSIERKRKTTRKSGGRRG